MIIWHVNISHHTIRPNNNPHQSHHVLIKKSCTAALPIHMGTDPRNHVYSYVYYYWSYNYFTLLETLHIFAFLFWSSASCDPPSTQQKWRTSSCPDSLQPIGPGPTSVIYQFSSKVYQTIRGDINTREAFSGVLNHRERTHSLFGPLNATPGQRCVFGFGPVVEYNELRRGTASGSERAWRTEANRSCQAPLLSK